MIELKGLYYQSGNQKVLPVLVQFDGTLLHVWHLSDPFYRLVTSDEFTITPPAAGRPGMIKVSSAIRIETDDVQTLHNLKANSDRLRRIKTRKAMKAPILAIMVALLCLLIGMWLAQKTGAA